MFMFYTLEGFFTKKQKKVELLLLAQGDKKIFSYFTRKELETL